MSIKVLVTGAKGQLGKTIEELYFENNLGIVFTFVIKEELDITKEKEIKSLFIKSDFDYCINCAAYTNVEQAEKTLEIAFKVNATGVKYLAEACKHNNVILIHISTDYVFDGEKKEPYTIDDIPNPINEYGKSKLKGEEYIKQILDNYFIVRTSWLYSKKYGNNFYRTILGKTKTEKELFVTDEQIGCPTNAVSLSNFIINLIKEKSDVFGVYHFCDRVSMTWYDFAKQILQENNIDDKINLVKANKYCTFAKRPKRSVLLEKLN